MPPSDDREALRSRGQSLDVTVHVGKDGVTEGVADEADAQLEDRDLVKARLLRSARTEEDREDLARELADRVGATLVEVRGNTVLLHRD